MKEATNINIYNFLCDLTWNWWQHLIAAFCTSIFSISPFFLLDFEYFIETVSFFSKNLSFLRNNAIFRRICLQTRLTYNFRFPIKDKAQDWHSSKFSDQEFYSRSVKCPHLQQKAIFGISTIFLKAVGKNIILILSFYWKLTTCQKQWSSWVRNGFFNQKLPSKNRRVKLSAELDSSDFTITRSANLE